MDTPFFKTQFFMGEKINIEMILFYIYLLVKFHRIQALELLFVEKNKNIINEL